MSLPKKQNHITRRSFIKKTSAAGSLAALSPISISSIFKSSSDDKRIIVVGAGLAGLSCAYELDKAGFNVILIESRSRPGGRVRTYRDPFADNLYAEMGGEYVGGTTSEVPPQVEEGKSYLGGNCTGTIVFEGTTMTWSKVTADTNDADGDGDTTELIDNPYVELIIDGPDGGTTFNMPLNKLQF